MGWVKLGDIKAVRDVLAPGTGPPCRKRAYGSAGAADAHIRALVKKEGPETTATLQSYQCRRCAQWHVGHVKGWEAEREAD